MITRTIALTLTLLASSQALSETLSLFTADSYSKLLEQKKDQSFKLIFWSVECTPCLEEMRDLGMTKPDSLNDMVFVATDDSEYDDDIGGIIKRFNLQKASHWRIDTQQFDDIRATVDAGWYGETPRRYQFNSQHQRRLIEN